MNIIDWYCLNVHYSVDASEARSFFNRVSQYLAFLNVNSL